MANVTLSHISKTYAQEVHAVKDVSLDIQDGEFLVLLGPSGCGKSTVLRMIAGLEEITGGKITIGDQDVTNLAPKDRNVAMVFQNYALYPHMTVAQNIGFGLKLRGASKHDLAKTINEAASLLGLENELDRRPGELSGGQRQRVALGRAIVREPAVFLFDEPLSNLDARLRSSMRLEITKLHQRLGTTMIYVTHDQVEAMTMGQRIVVMRDGEILQVDDPLTVYNSPSSIFVASFIGSPTINLLDGIVSNKDSKSVNLPDLECSVTIDSISVASEPIAPGLSVKVGIRPEGFRVPNSVLHSHQKGENDPNELPTIRGITEVVEPLGNETIVHVRVQKTLLVARVSAQHNVSAGQAIELSISPTFISVFDSQTGQRL